MMEDKLRTLKSRFGCILSRQIANLRGQGEGPFQSVPYSYVFPSPIIVHIPNCHSSSVDDSDTEEDNKDKDDDENANIVTEDHCLIPPRPSYSGPFTLQQEDNKIFDDQMTQTVSPPIASNKPKSPSTIENDTDTGAVTSTSLSDPQSFIITWGRRTLIFFAIFSLGLGILWNFDIYLTDIYIRSVMNVFNNRILLPTWFDPTWFHDGVKCLQDMYIYGPTI